MGGMGMGGMGMMGQMGMGGMGMMGAGGGKVSAANTGTESSPRVCQNDTTHDAKSWVFG
jgi:hypothetical protein